MTAIRIGKVFGLICSVLAGAQAWSAGLEKNIMFGGRSAGVAGIASPYVQGAEALYFNPAGLVTDKPGHSVAFDISPTSSRFEAPIVADNVTSKSDAKLLLPLALMYSQNVSEDLGLGIGFYTSGGAYSLFKDQTFAGKQGTAESKTDIIINELALGAGYKVSDRLKLGLAYRVVMTQANISTVDQSTLVLNAKIRDLKDTNYGAFKLGAQYKVTDKTDLSFTYRSDSPIKAKGTVGGNVIGAGAPKAIADAPVTVHATFPDAYAIGVQHEINDQWRVLGEFVYTSYSRLKNFQVQGDLKVPTFPAANRSNPAIQLGWKDEQSVKLAAEYLGFGMPLRYGYIWTSRVTDAQFARPGLTPPAPAHTFTLGTGMNLMESLTLDAGAEYTFSSGDGHANAKLGEYKVTAYALHLGVQYTF